MSTAPAEDAAHVVARVAELVVEVAIAPGPRRVELLELSLPQGSTVLDAVKASGLLGRHGLTWPADLSLAVWGRNVTPETPLRSRDRVELLRGLQVDPKEARRLRYRSQAERAPGRVRPKR